MYWHVQVYILIAGPYPLSHRNRRGKNSTMSCKWLSRSVVSKRQLDLGRSCWMVRKRGGVWGQRWGTFWKIWKSGGVRERWGIEGGSVGFQQQYAVVSFLQLSQTLQDSVPKRSAFGGINETMQNLQGMVPQVAKVFQCVYLMRKIEKGSGTASVITKLLWKFQNPYQVQYLIYN